MTPIGRVLASPNHAGRSYVSVDEAYVPGLAGIDRYSHLIIVWLMHGASFDPAMHLSGVFATRAKERPNPIGVTVVESLRVDDELLTVRGLDALDGSPVLDIKPYVAKTDAVVNAV